MLMLPSMHTDYHRLEKIKQRLDFYQPNMTLLHSTHAPSAFARRDTNGRHRTFFVNQSFLEKAKRSQSLGS
jgi:hypothetical protein